ncbi:nicotinamide/nicotinic acid mononucleotide adenylyltransferase 1-like [Asterias rubens]|uniref:nicotinamide/nicotinic acid mononucleotide adenylyltransferase 1-like n=1 Tax=Asterias rubens TaxID=7604 RepID=UPI001455D108|nr:nicotinamide/nicotinic acid mononucleotide adenylyltransferase 1-like [Asterias rubens]
MSTQCSCEKMAAPTKVVLLACGSFNPITNMHLRMFEIAKDYLHRIGNFQVISGIISPVHDAYGKKGLVSAKHRLEMCSQALKTSDWIKLNSWETEQEGWTETAKTLRHFRDEANSDTFKVPNQAFTSPVSCTTIPVRPARKRRRSNKNQDMNSDFLVTLRTVSSLSCFGGTLGAADNDHYEEMHYTSCTNNMNLQPVQVKLLCGADLLESFAVPGLWKDEDITEIVKKYGLVVITRSDSNPQKFIYESDVLYRYQKNIHIVTEWIFNDISSTKVRRAVSRTESIRYIVPDPVIRYIGQNKLYQMIDSEKEKD